MAMHWCWTFSIGMPTTWYANSTWGVSSASLNTASVTNLSSPVTPGIPGDQYNYNNVNGGFFLTTPAFPAGSLAAGWALFRWNANGNTLSSSAGRPIVQLRDGGTTRVEVRSAANAATAQLNLYVNGSLVGTTVAAYGGAEDYLAIDFDLAVPEAGLVVNGTREIMRASSGAAGTIDRIHLGGSSNCWWGDMIVFNSIADLTDAETQDVWVAYLAPDSATELVGTWTPSTTTLVGDVSDHTGATYDQTVSDPATISFGFESTTDREPGWNPATVYGVAVVSYGTADVLTATTLILQDAGGNVTTRNVTLNTTGDYVWAGSALASGAVAWTAAAVNTVTAEYTVT